MSSDEMKSIYSDAEMIVCGYAFTKTEDGNVRVLDLRKPHHALLMSMQGEVLETTMDDVELSIVEEYWKRNQKYMSQEYREESYA